MFARLLILFILIPVIELILFMGIGQRIGFPTTFAIVIITAIIGAALTKSQGLKALKNYQSALAQGKLPHEEVIDGLLILVAGAVLLTPGFLTDAIGFALLIPTTRNVIRTFLKGYLGGKISVVAPHTQANTQATKQRTSQSDVITVEAEVVDDSPTPHTNHQRETNH